MRAVKFQIVLLLFAGFQAGACPQGYESPEALVKRARVILELEVLSVTNAPPPVIKKQPFSLKDDDPQERTNAQATVRVVKCLKGGCAAQTFTLIGGPYDSCAPYFCYLKFKPGEHLALIIEHELPSSLKAVVVNWRCRVLEPKEPELAGLMKGATEAWRKQVELYKSTTPEAFARADALHKTPAKNGRRTFSAEPYPVLACLRILWSNPEDLLPLPLTERKSASSVRKKTEADLEPEIDPFAGEMVDGAYHTLQYEHKTDPPELEEALQSRLKNNPSEFVAFNKQLLGKVLIEELGLQRAKATEIINSLKATDTFCKTDFEPYKCHLGSGVAEKGKLRPLQYALELADDEPDSLVWSTFGLGFHRKEKPTLDSTYIAFYVERNPQKDYRSWPRLVLLLSAPDLRMSAVVQRYLNQENNMYRMDQYAMFFLALRQYPEAGRVLSRFEALAADEVRGATAQESKAQTRESIQRMVKEFHSLLGLYDCKDAAVLEHLRNLETRAASL